MNEYWAQRRRVHCKLKFVERMVTLCTTYSMQNNVWDEIGGDHLLRRQQKQPFIAYHIVE